LKYLARSFKFCLFTPQWRRRHWR